MASLRCFINGGCRNDVVLSQWLPTDEAHKTVRLLRFYECPWCHVTHATITSPELEETRYARPEPYVYTGEPAGA